MTASTRAHARPRVVHIIDRLNVGGMESVALAVIAATRDRYEHVIIGLRERGELAARAETLGIPVESIGKQPGKDPAAYMRLYHRLRALAPDIVHSYNIGALDAAVPARLAGCRRVVHAEHGRDAADPNGSNRKYRWLRRLMAPAISRFVPVSADLARWLEQEVRIPRAKIALIRNGIDTERFAPGPAVAVPGLPTCAEGTRVIGTVGRLDPVKGFDHLLEAMASLVARKQLPPLHLVIIGGGPEYSRLARRVDELGLTPYVTLTGQRDDADAWFKHFDVYVCSSIAEGIALTVLEAMASALPVVATAVGGNPELVADGETGLLVPARRPEALADALARVVADPERARTMGEAGRRRVQAHFSVGSMVDGYGTLYDALLAR
ncbi:glycosyltransferase [Salinisphaera hydrothermalis]|uniref:glycosyltransferase n=1 Tax=Salinisphaera hydrothermalis TaxID=563188 RepID=UPI000566EFCF|nr:glycosyltransferase [Salinisphaera hydrothermalis]